MKLVTLAVAAALAVGSLGIANATLVQNGDFSQISTPSGARVVTAGTPTQLNLAPVFLGRSYGEFVDNWTTTGSLLSQNVVWFPTATAASTVNASDFDTIFFGTPYRPLLPTSVTAPPGDGAFLAMQSNLTDSGIQQTITGLMPGQAYTVSFSWAATMDNIDTSGGETSSLTASIDGASHTTGPQTVSSNSGPSICIFGSCVPTHSTPTFSGWLPESFGFVADTSSSVLKFLASGTPSGLPPYALLSGVSIDMVAVPEPSSLGMFGVGLLGLGLVTVYGRRRQRRRKGIDVV